MARFEARISSDLHALLKRAAELEGRTVTNFVVSAVQATAQRAIEGSDLIRLSMADQDNFAQALLAPPAQPQHLSAPSIVATSFCVPDEPISGDTSQCGAQT